MNDRLDDVMQSLKDSPVPMGPSPELAARTAYAMTDAAARGAPAPRRRALSRWSGIAAVLVLGIGGILLLRNTGAGLESIALADVTERALQTQTVACNVREHWGSARAMIKRFCYVRMERDNGEIRISDLKAGRTLFLNPEAKEAVISGADEQIGFDIYGWLQRLQNRTEKDLGRKELDGRKVVGFRVVASIPASGGTATAPFDLWVDCATGLPVQIDALEETGIGVQGTIASDIRFGVELDDALFDMSIPEGYAVRDVRKPGSDRPSGATGELSVYTVNQPVSEFTDENDFSTPQAAYANINRALIAGTDAGWRRVSVSSSPFGTDNTPRYELSPEQAKTWLEAIVIEVHRCGTQHAGVIARASSPGRYHRDRPAHGRVGEWALAQHRPNGLRERERGSGGVRQVLRQAVAQPPGGETAAADRGTL